MKYKKVKELFLVYLEAKGDSERTIGTYDQRTRLFLVDTAMSENADLGEFTPEMMDRWVVVMRRRGLAPDTVRSRVTDIRAFFRWCVRRDYLSKSPADHLSIKRIRKLTVKSMKPSDLKKILAAAEHPRDVALVHFIASTGCRSGEAANLRIADLNIAKREAMVCGKTGPRFVDFDRCTAAAMNDWLDCHPYKEGGFVFVGTRAPFQPVINNTIYQIFRRLAMVAGVDGRFNPHSVRHLVGKMWTEKTNLELARQKLGHADISTTAIYANQDREQVKKYTDEVEIF